MSVSKARKRAFQAAEAAANRAGTSHGNTAAIIAIAYALLELSHQARRLADLVPVYGPREEQ